MEEKQPPDDPKTLADFLWRMEVNADAIFVREQADCGDRTSPYTAMALSELTPERRAYHMARFVEQWQAASRWKGANVAGLIP